MYENIYFKNVTYNSHCFFHFAQMIRRKLISSGLALVKLNKLNVEILRNVEALCFIEIKNIGKFKKIIIDNLSKVNNNKNFITYLNNYIFKLNPNDYNFCKLINYCKENNKDKFLEKIYTSNNISESINSKINYNLPKKSTNNFSFLNSISKFLLNENNCINQNKTIIRTDFITKTFLKFIDDKEFNKNLHWIEYEEFSEIQKEELKI